MCIELNLCVICVVQMITFCTADTASRTDSEQSFNANSAFQCKTLSSALQLIKCHLN